MEHVSIMWLSNMPVLWMPKKCLFWKSISIKFSSIANSSFSRFRAAGYLAAFGGKSHLNYFTYAVFQHGYKIIYHNDGGRNVMAEGMKPLISGCEFKSQTWCIIWGRVSGLIYLVPQDHVNLMIKIKNSQMFGNLWRQTISFEWLTTVLSFGY